ncbi:unnamed protein product, partial [Didymodactylos carnosus]
KTCVAIYDYNARTDVKLTFRVGEILIVFDDSQEDQWPAKHCQTGLKGYIPAVCVAPYGGLDVNVWFHNNVIRREAERLLLNPINPRGCFLVRNSEKMYAHTDDQRGAHVKHYNIRSLDAKQGYYIAARRVFKTLEELVQHYSENVDGLCCQLTIACPRPTLTTCTISKDIWEVPRNSLQFIRKLGQGDFGEVLNSTLEFNSHCIHS